MRDYLQSFRNREVLWQLFRLGLIGGFNTIVSFAMFNLLFFGFDWESEWSVIGSWSVGTALSYVLNRRWTFGLREYGSAPETARFFFVNGIAALVTLAVVEGAESWLGPLDKIEANGALVFAAGLIVLPKFAAYRDLVFRKSLRASRLSD